MICSDDDATGGGAVTVIGGRTASGMGAAGDAGGSCAHATAVDRRPQSRATACRHRGRIIIRAFVISR
jgi:hypothetical protein